MVNPTSPPGQYGELKAAAIEALSAPNRTFTTLTPVRALSVVHPIYVAALEAKDREIERLGEEIAKLRTALAKAQPGHDERYVVAQRYIEAEQREAEARKLLKEAIRTLHAVIPAAYTGPTGIVTKARNFLESKP